MTDQTQAPQSNVPNKSFFYTLVCGELLFAQGGEKTLRAVRMNTIIRGENSPNITAHQMGRSQVALQMELHKRMGTKVKLDIQDVVIMSLSPMGYMTEEEFKAMPDKVRLAEMDKQDGVA